jgi:predicted dehydrogenase/aryl-alcohol dehydrogenase-like predicted oxidoreductase
MTDKLRWGILATGAIAKTFGRQLTQSKTGTLVAVGSRSQESADAFGDEFKVPHRYGSYQGVLDDEEVQAVYVSPPHPMHAECAIKTAEAGKHILCEKPIGMNHAEAMAIIEAAHRNDVFLMEAFMYRCHPQTRTLVELIRDKVIGDVKVIHATFSFRTAFNPESRLLKNALGGGGILDVGCYTASMSRLVAGVATGKDFAEPIELNACGHLGEITRTDEYAIASLRFPGDILAQLSSGVQVQQECVVRIYGTEGYIFTPSPWIPAREPGETKIIVHRHGEEKPREITIKTERGLYAIEADVVAENIERRQAPAPAMSWDDTLGNMKTLDMWREAIGLVYDLEKPEAQILPVHKRPLRFPKESKMKFGKVEGVEKPVSRLVMGVDNQRSMPHAAVMFDDYFERGGNCFDTAWIYGGGSQERLLGHWVKNRDVRDKVVIIAKGAHTPHCDPQSLTRELIESLERLQIDCADIYLMHRDNPDIPVGEFVDVLNEHKQAGRIRVFGGSNWALERVDAANEYAESKGLTGFAAVSNNLSLARMIEPPWPGCLASSDSESRDWFSRTGVSLFAWSSQGRGFFTGRAHPDDHSDPGLVRCWYSEDNFQRLARAEELAQKKGVLPINIALAYVLCQPFPTFALIGPRTLAETRTSFESLGVELTPEELRWLSLEA